MSPDIAAGAATIMLNPLGFVPGVNSDIVAGSDASIFQRTLPGLISEPLLVFSLIVTDSTPTFGHSSTNTAPRLSDPEP
jgi:hypothetical protein